MKAYYKNIPPFVKEEEEQDGMTTNPTINTTDIDLVN